MATFADRLWWSRHRLGMGANKLAQAVGFSQSLLSSLERSNSNRSKYNDRFAEVLEVDPIWLQTGDVSKAPEGFDPVAAAEGRERAVSVSPMTARQEGNVTRLRDKMPQSPAWMGRPPEVADDQDEMRLMNTLTSTVLALARLIGPTKTKALVELASQMTALVSQSSEGENKVGSTD